MDRKILICPTKGLKTLNAYVFNNVYSDRPLGDITNPDTSSLTADGAHVATPANPDPAILLDATYDNIAYEQSDFIARHSEKYVVGYLDGHVTVTRDVPETSGLPTLPAPPPLVLHAVVWNALVTDPGDDIVGSSIGPWGQAQSTNTIDADGWLQFKVTIPDGQELMVALSVQSTRMPYPNGYWRSLQYVFYVWQDVAGGPFVAHIMKGQTDPGNLFPPPGPTAVPGIVGPGTPYALVPGDTYRIERVGTSIIFKHSTNGITFTTDCTITGTAPGALIADCWNRANNGYWTNCLFYNNGL